MHAVRREELSIRPRWYDLRHRHRNASCNRELCRYVPCYRSYCRSQVMAHGLQENAAVVGE